MSGHGGLWAEKLMLGLVESNWINRLQFEIVCSE